MSAATERRDREGWLRRQGLPLLIPSVYRAIRVFRAASPFVLLALLVGTALALIDAQLGQVANLDLEDIVLPTSAWVIIAIALLLFVLAIPLAIAFHYWFRRRRVYTQNAIAGVLLFLYLGGLAIVGVTTDSGFGLQLPIGDRILILVGIYLIVFIELPAIVRWASVRVVREFGSLGPMVGRVLPFLLLSQLLVFFTNEIWQLAYRLDAGRMWLVNAILVLPIVILVVSASVDALRDELATTEPWDPTLLHGTPFEGEEDRGMPRLRVGDWINLILVPMAVQLIQIALFVALICCYFVLLGSIALSPELMSNWTGQPPVRMVWLGINLPIDRSMFRVSLILAVFSGLSFAASNVTDPNYRRIFLQPVMDEMRRNLAILHVYDRRR